MDKVRWKAINALYGKGEPPTQEEVRWAIAREKNSVEGKEFNHQTKLIVWLDRMDLLCFHPANGGYRLKNEAYKLKMMGVKPGTPDVFIMVPKKPYHGLILELKREKGGVVSDAQKWWLNGLNKNRYLAVVSETFDKSKEIVLNYLKGEDW